MIRGKTSPRHDVIPANAGISVSSSRIAGKQTEIPAFAGMTPVDLARERGVQTLQTTGSINREKL
jgi:hypothetical protein